MKKKPLIRCVREENASLPTVAVESVSLSCIVDAEKGRDVAVIDTANAFMQTCVEDKKDMAFIKIRGVLVDILVDIAPEVYKKHVTKDKNGVAQSLVQCQNALCGTMVASPLCCRKFVKSLTSVGFIIDLCDACVANKMINLKMSHVKPEAMDKTIKCLRQECKSMFEDGSGAMTVSCGEIHTHLGMKLDFTAACQVAVAMFEHLDDTPTVFENIEPNGAGTESSAAPVNLLAVNEDCEKLEDDKAVQFHDVVAKTLCVTKRARPDTCTPVAFLTMRVREPDKDDWKKMVHLMCHVRGARDMPLVLSANGSHVLKWWVDGSFAVRPNLRGHAGRGLSLGRGFPVVGSTKHKLNTRSSAEAELVGADDFMPAICWTRCFMEAQGHNIEDDVLCQDNKSSILLEKNGEASSSKRKKHVNVRFFFVTD
jgi:hypothetical protein